MADYTQTPTSSGAYAPKNTRKSKTGLAECVYPRTIFISMREFLSISWFIGIR